MREKILSIPEHISDQHSFPQNTEHKKCQHPDYPVGTRTKAWLLPDSLVSGTSGDYVRQNKNIEITGCKQSEAGNSWLRQLQGE